MLKHISAQTRSKYGNSFTKIPTIPSIFSRIVISIRAVQTLISKTTETKMCDVETSNQKRETGPRHWCRQSTEKSWRRRASVG